MRLLFLTLSAIAGMIIASGSNLFASEMAIPKDAQVFWNKGQLNLEKGNPKLAAQDFRKALEIFHNFAKAHYSMAVACLALGNDVLASVHLKCYLDLEPENVVARQNYADLLLRMEQVDKAKEQFELFLKEAQKFGPEAQKLMVHTHSRLMSIAQMEGDEYSEHLHRGIGMYYLGLEKERNPDEFKEEDHKPEAILIRAAAELTQARMLRSDQVKSCWYLYLVWDKLCCSQPANRWLKLVSQEASLNQLTPREYEAFQLASRERETQFPRK